MANTQDNDAATINIERHTLVADAESVRPNTGVGDGFSKNEWVVCPDEPLELGEDTSLCRRINGAEISSGARREHELHRCDHLASANAETSFDLVECVHTTARNISSRAPN